jgi:hypothetical protein
MRRAGRWRLVRFDVVGLDDVISERALRFKRVLRRKTPDAITAATALVRDACLMMRDRALVRGIPGLTVVTPPLRNRTRPAAIGREASGVRRAAYGVWRSAVRLLP